MNWWKWGCILSLLAFEGAREIIVMQDKRARFHQTSQILTLEGYTEASGQWLRTDGGEALVPQLVRFQCDESRKECIGAATMDLSGTVMHPEIDRFHATFSDGIISFTDDAPVCVVTKYRIDTRLEKAFAVREKRKNPDKPLLGSCDTLEERMEMTLGSSRDLPQKLPTEGHFVPIASVLFWLFHSPEKTAKS